MPTMTLRVKTGEGVYTDSGVDYMFQWPLTAEYARVFPEARVSADWTTFYAWTAELAGNVPAPGDKVVDDASRTWTVRHVEAIVRESQYRMICRRDLE